ncbi:ankyrin repeat domain-containing protein 17 [Seiridium cupressi]
MPSIVPSQNPKEDTSFILTRHAGLGNLEMVQHLLGTGTDIHGQGRLNRNPLTTAACYCHVDVVLLERGADPNYQQTEQRDSPLTAAASSGSMTIVRKLVDAGTKCADDNWGTLCYAVFLEHTSMIELFLAMDIGVTASQPQIPGKAAAMGLESMIYFEELQLLQ